LDETAAGARAAGRPARVHLKVDTGLGRGGSPPADLPGLLTAALRYEAEGLVHLVGLFSHLACSDVPAHPSVAVQVARFDEAVELAERAGARLELRHLANSAAALALPHTRYDAVRPGLAVYGLSPLPDLATPVDLGLRPAMSLLGRIALVKDVPAGQGVSYGLTYTTDTESTLALVPLGYGDGLPRHAGGVGPVWVGGERVSVAGVVCMDQIVLDLGGVTDRVQPGDVAVLFGPGEHGEPTAQDWAAAAGTIS
jgi:alanine racemase